MTSQRLLQSAAKIAGVATWTEQSLWHAGLSANWPDVMVPSDLQYVKATYDAGSVPFLHMMFKPATSAPHPILTAIDRGDYDADIDAWLREVLKLADQGVRLVVTPYPEMNGIWTNYGPNPHNFRADAAARIFRSIVLKGRKLGLTSDKVLWCWAPNDVGWGPLEPYYPGDDVVDIVGGSCYNWGGFGYSWASWQTPAEVIDPYVAEVRRFTQKPIIITQVGSGEGDSRTPAWLDQLVEYVKASRDVLGFIWFSISEFTYTPGLDDFNRRVASLDADRPDGWFSMSPVTFDRDQGEWGSVKEYADGTLLPWTVDKIVIHWGGSTNPGSGEASEAAVLRAWQRNHLAKKPHPWTDIAYNYAFGNSSLVYRLRGWNRAAATSGDFDGDGIPENEEAVAFVWIGGQGYTQTQAAFKSLGRAVREVLAWNPQAYVTVHSDHKATACPGDTLRKWVDDKGWEETELSEVRVLKYGDGTRSKRDAFVAAAQRGMTVMGYPDRLTIDRKCGADGIFRSGTTGQVRRFQRAKSLPVTGTFGAAEWKALGD